MNVLELADSLKTYVNWDKSQLVRETLEFPYDFYRAIEHGLREIGKHARIFEKIILLPIEKGVKHYSLDLTKLTQQQIEIVKILSINMIDTNGEISKTLDNVYLEQIEKSLYLNSTALAEILFGQSHYLKMSESEDGTPTGIYCELTEIVSPNEITVSQSLTATHLLYNLSKSDEGEYLSSLITVGGTTVTLQEDVGEIPYSWEEGDKLYSISSSPAFFKIVLQVIPKEKYFTLGTESIPIPDSLLKHLRDLAVGHLYSILIPRDINFAQTYQALINVQQVFSYSQSLTEAKKKVTKAVPLIVRSYDPY